MATFSYLCGGCGEIRELQRQVADRDNVVMCPYCVRVMVREQAAPGFALKGDGWYATDYGTPKPKEQAD